MNLPQLGALVHGWSGVLHMDIRDYCFKPGYTNKQTIEIDIKNVRDAIALLEMELQKRKEEQEGAKE